MLTFINSYFIITFICVYIGCIRNRCPQEHLRRQSCPSGVIRQLTRVQYPQVPGTACD